MWHKCDIIMYKNMRYYVEGNEIYGIVCVCHNLCHCFSST